MPFALNQLRSQQVRVLKGTDAFDIVSMALEIGENPRTFFIGEDWSDLDLTNTDVHLASFKDAIMDRVVVFPSQLEHILGCGPKSIDDAVIVPEPEHLDPGQNQVYAEEGSRKASSTEQVRPPRLQRVPKDDFVSSTAFNVEQGYRARRLYSAVVMNALDEAIADDKKYGNGTEQIVRWARSRDGQEVLRCAGIDPNERAVRGLQDFVAKGVRTSKALDRRGSIQQLFE